MAAQSKTTAVHFSLIFFVMLSVILGVVAYLFYSDYREQQTAFTKNQGELSAAQAASTRYMQEIDALKKAIGLELPEVGVVTPGDNTVLSQASQAVQSLGANPAAGNLVVALRDLRTELDKKNVELGERQNTNAELQAKVEALDGQYKTREAAHDEKRQMTETDLAGQQSQFAESITAKDTEINQFREQVAALQTELDQTKEQMAAENAKIREENRLLLAKNQDFREELDKIRGESFEVADGEIRRVDQVNRTVWINIGSDDNLQKRTTFSVYAKNNAGIGREGPSGGRPEDIKGSIEVTKIINDGLAEARILSDDTSRPISPGDPIYTPLWSAGRTEKFAFVGQIDVDNDGSFVGDRERLHEIVAASGAEISSEVLDDGSRIPKRADDEPVPINEQTRFLVIGAIPEPLDEANLDRRAQLQLMQTHKTEMDKEARTSGVRVVSLNTFLDYIGFVPQQRRWVPGENPTWTLDAGSRRSAADKRSGGGNTSGLFDANRRRPSGSGTTSQTFEGGDGR